MIIASLLLASLTGQKEASVARFFPLNPGDKFVFEEEFDKTKKTFTDVVGQPQEMKGRISFPVETFFQGNDSVGKVFYHLDGERVLVTGLDFSGALPTPYPIMVAGDGPRSFVWTGETPVPNGAPEPLSLSGESKPGKPVTYLGKKRETIEVTLTSEVAGLTSVQKSTYAEGLGLIHMLEESGRMKLKRTRKLIEYRPAGGS
jgi:hypothetical protein